jgi:hypothetical protein
MLDSLLIAHLHRLGEFVVTGVADISQLVGPANIVVFLFDKFTFAVEIPIG